jgi:seryl-tRNA synthetase
MKIKSTIKVLFLLVKFNQEIKMIDLKTLKDENVRKNLEKRGYYLPQEYFLLEKERKDILIAIEQINHKINQNNHDIHDKEMLKKFKKELEEKENQIHEITYKIPNILHESVPEGKNEQENKDVMYFFNDQKMIHDKFYGEQAKNLGLDIETGVHLAQTRFHVMRGILAKKQRELINKALDFYGTLGYEECYVPNLVNEETIFGTGQYPKFKDELFITEGNQKLYLIPTGEVPLTNIVKNKILLENEAEMKLMTHTPCFRKEAGAYGKDTKGIIRQHQFEKVELVRTCLPENGLKNFEEMVNDVQNFIKQLEIPFRIIELCAGDIGFAGHKAYDFEIWFPNEKKYREIATITWCHDFQARRMNAKYKNKENKKNYLHTLNGTGLAVGRILAAMIENEKIGK